MKLNEIQVGTIYKETGRYGGELLVTGIDQQHKVVKAKRVYLDETVENVEVPFDDLQLDYGYVNTYRPQQIRHAIGTPEEVLATRKASIAQRRNQQVIRETHENYIKQARQALAAIGIESRPHTTTTGRSMLGFDADELAKLLARLGIKIGGE